MGFGIREFVDSHDITDVKEESKKAVYGLTGAYFTIPDFLAGDGKVPWKFTPDKADRLGDLVRKRYMEDFDVAASRVRTYSDFDEVLNSPEDEFDGQESIEVGGNNPFIRYSLPGTMSYLASGAAVVSPKLAAVVMGTPVAANYGYMAAQKTGLIQDAADADFSDFTVQELDSGSISDIDYNEIVSVLESDRSVESLRTNVFQDLFYVELGLEDILNELESSDIAEFEVYGDEKESFFAESYLKEVFNDLGSSEEPVFVFEESNDEVYKRRLVVPESVELGLANLQSDDLKDEEYLVEPAIDITYKTDTDNLPISNNQELEGEELVEETYLTA